MREGCKRAVCDVPLEAIRHRRASEHRRTEDVPARVPRVTDRRSDCRGKQKRLDSQASAARKEVNIW